MHLHQLKKHYIFKYIKQLSFCFAMMSLLVACSNPEISNSEPNINPEPTMSENNNEQAAVTAVTAVTFSGQANNYTLSVTIESPDTGCDQYADWWEVFNADHIRDIRTY